VFARGRAAARGDGGRRGERGFTLIEIIVVLAIVALVLTLAVLRIDHLSPKYAVRAAAREVGGLIDLAPGTAAGKGRRTAIEYDIDQGLYRLYGPPPPGEEGSGPWGLAPAGPPKSLPRGVRFRGAYAHAKGMQLQTSGVLRVRFDPLSIEGSHIVYVENDFQGGKQWSVKYNALLGSCDYVEGLAEFESPPDQ
jgi:prepilin-type N-terminal cleavage/methylation domain-containing protein